MAPQQNPTDSSPTGSRCVSFRHLRRLDTGLYSQLVHEVAAAVDTSRLLLDLDVVCGVFSWQPGEAIERLRSARCPVWKYKWGLFDYLVPFNSLRRHGLDIPKLIEYYTNQSSLAMLIDADWPLRGRAHCLCAIGAALAQAVIPSDLTRCKWSEIDAGDVWVTGSDGELGRSLRVCLRGEESCGGLRWGKSMNTLVNSVLDRLAADTCGQSVVLLSSTMKWLADSGVLRHDLEHYRLQRLEFETPDGERHALQGGYEVGLDEPYGRRLSDLGEEAVAVAQAIMTKGPWSIMDTDEWPWNHALDEGGWNHIDRIAVVGSPEGFGGLGCLGECREHELTMLG